MSVRLLLVALSAALNALAFPPWSLPAVAWVAVAPLMVALHGLRWVQGAWLGLLWGTLAIWGVGWWVPAAISSYYGQPLWFGVLFSVAASIVFAGSYSAGFAACACWLSARLQGSTRVLAIAALWVSWELARARLLTGDPWLLLGYSLVPSHWLAQAADLGGVYLLSFLLMIVNVAIAECWTARARGMRAISRVACTVAAVIGIALVYGAARAQTAWPTQPRRAISIVQGNNSLGAQWRREFYGQGLSDYLQLSRESAQRSRPDLLVWPESAVTFFLAHEPAYRYAIADLLDEIGAQLIVGGPHHEGSSGGEASYFNSAFHLGTDGAIRARYDKMQLLPFAEYFPLRTVELLRRSFERVRAFHPGSEAVLIDTGLEKIAVAICFEAIFPELIRAQVRSGAQMLLNLSNDAWLGSGPGPEQHLLMARLRAIENRLWMVRSTTTGISAVIDPAGNVRARTAPNVAATIEAEVVPVEIATLYTAWGDWFAYLCVVSALVAMAASAVRSARRPTRPAVPPDPTG